MSTILVAADAKWVRDLVKSACTAQGQRVIEVTRGQDVRDTVGTERPDLVILDMQIGNMGGIASRSTCASRGRPGASPTRRSCCSSIGRPIASSPSGPTPTPSW